MLVWILVLVTQSMVVLENGDITRAKVCWYAQSKDAPREQWRKYVAPWGYKCPRTFTEIYAQKKEGDAAPSTLESDQPISPVVVSF